MLDESIRREAQIVRRLKSLDLNIGVFPCYVDEGEIKFSDRVAPFLITKFCFGIRPLGLFAFDTQRGELQYWIRAARLLGELHKRRIVHGDIHQGNLLIDSASRPVLLDFGNSQYNSRFSFLKRSSQRHFGPAVAMHADEVTSPHDLLLPSFDVMCLMEVANTRLAKYFEDGDWERAAHTLSSHSDRYAALLRVCRAPAPEHRPKDGSALADGFEKVLSGPTFAFRPDSNALAKVILRRYPRLTAATIAFAVIMFACVGLLLARQQQLKREAERDAIALERLQASNAIAIESIQDFLSASVERDRLLEEVPSTTRELLGKRLVALMQADVLTVDARTTALEVGLQLASSVMELDGWKASMPIIQACVLEAQKIAVTNGGMRERLLEIQANAVLVKILNEKGSLSAEKSMEARALSRKTADEWLEVPVEQLNIPERILYCSTAVAIARDALYPQRREKWFKDENGERLWQVLDRSIRVASQDKEKNIVQLIELKCLLGLAKHKGAFVGSSHYPSGPNIGPLAQQDYHSALDLIRSYAGKSSSFTPRQTRQIEARIKSVLGMSYTNQLRYVEARKLLSDAYAIREVTSKEFPGSLRRQREFISTGWNYADAIQREAVAQFQSVDTSSIHREEIAIRTVVVEKCKEVLERDRNSDTEMDYLVNSTRLATAYVLVGQVATANDILLDVEKRVGLDCFEFTRLGLEGVVALAVLKHSHTSEHYALKLHHYVDQLVEFMEDRPNKLEPPWKRRFAKHSKMFIHAATSIQCAELKKMGSWEICKCKVADWEGLNSR